MENRTINGTPEWWLASYGWTNDFGAASTNDYDKDGFMTWQEWVALTDPTNEFDKLLFWRDALNLSEGNIVHWTGRSNRFYSIVVYTNLLNESSNLANDLIWPQDSFTDTLHNAEGPIYYRIKVCEP